MNKSGSDIRSIRVHPNFYSSGKLSGLSSKLIIFYLEKHRHRIVNYQYYQAEQICSIGSDAIESTVKQIERRTKIYGVQRK